MSNIFNTKTDRNGRKVLLTADSVEYVVSGHKVSYIYYKNSKMMKVAEEWSNIQNFLEENFECLVYDLPNKKKAIIPNHNVGYMIDDESKHSYVHFLNSNHSLRVVGGILDHDIEWI